MRHFEVGHQAYHILLSFGCSLIFAGLVFFELAENK